jgi:hypothetical protein|tara:strand:- start:117 stop:266 length:150 start_codon:yes stop_codon:yes gene_type:complete
MTNVQKKKKIKKRKTQMMEKIKEWASYLAWYEVPLFAVAILVIASAILF